ncbi:MAG: ROK family protein [Lachnospiraceae bacterium]|nr:ROK family protein [Lachnospiraceae bacterium]
MTSSILINNTFRVKETNTNLVRKALRKLEKATRTEISRETGLSIATCGTILNDLLITGEVFEDELDNGRGGRPARKYLYNKNHSLVIGMTIHSDDNLHILRYVISNLSGEILEKGSDSYHCLSLDIIEAILEILLSKYPAIRALGIGIPGYSDKEGNILVNDVSELNGIHLAKSIKEKHGIDVKIASSPNLTAYGYFKHHRELKGKTFAAIIAPKGHPVGAGFIIADKMYRGDTNLAGEISYMNFNSPSTQSEKEKFHDSMITVITAIITVLAPSKILVTGSAFSKESYAQINSSCEHILSKEFLPEFEFKSDVSDDYLNGVVQMALDSMSYTVQLIAS